MRVNIYGEELTSEIEIIKKKEGDRTFVGIRFYLKSHPALHHTEDDNDQSAVTFWVPWTKEKGNNFDLLASIFEDAVSYLGEHETRTEGAI